MILLIWSPMGFVRDRWEQYVHRPYDLYCMRAAPLVSSPNYRKSNTLGPRAESAYGGGIQSIRYRPSTPPRARVTEVVGPVLVFKQQATSKQAASTCKIGKNHSSIVVLWIRPKFWWMLPMGVRDNHTKYEPETQRWLPRTCVASAGPRFQNLQCRAKISLFFCPKPP